MEKSNLSCLVCNCEGTMPLDGKKLSEALGLEVNSINTHLCRSQLNQFEKTLELENPVLVACTQEAPLFSEIANERGKSNQVDFVNIREMAGWSEQAEESHPKIAALMDYAVHRVSPAKLKSITSDGLCLVYGSGQFALETAQLLSDKLSVTLLLSDDSDFVLPSTGTVPIFRGDIVRAEGSFGEYSLTVDNYSPLMPSAKESPSFIMARDGAKTECSLILDLSGKTPLFSGHEFRDGYVRVEASDHAKVFRSIIDLIGMVGEFEKPIYVDYSKDICAHSRSKITGCSKCMDVCPTGAITDSGDYVNIDAGICGGCGSCHAVCPTGAVSYQYPQRSDLIGSVQTLLNTYEKAGGKNPVILLYSEPFGAELIGAIARYSRGLPANVLPLSLHSTHLPGHVEMAAMIASGAQHILILADPKHQESIHGLQSECELTNTILERLEICEHPRIIVVSSSDPDKVEEEIWSLPKDQVLSSSKFEPIGTKRDIARLSFAKLLELSPNKPDLIPLPDNAPYGKVNIDQSACTLCMSCASACPAAAIIDTPGEPKLRFVEAACVQCGICVNTCPENALSLTPQLNLTDSAIQPTTLYEEEPFACIECGTPFATQSTIQKITEQLSGKHAMFADSEQARLIKMCGDCRVQALANSSSDPFSAGPKPRPRTTEDYLEAEKGNLTVKDFLIDD